MYCQGHTVPIPASLQSALPKHCRKRQRARTVKPKACCTARRQHQPLSVLPAAALKPSQGNSQSPISRARYLLGSLFLTICNLRYLLVHLKSKACREVLWNSLEDAGITPNEWSTYSGINVICDDWCCASGLQLKCTWNCEEGASPKAWLSWQLKQMKHTARVQMGLCEGGFQFGLIWHCEDGNTGFYLLINLFRTKTPEHYFNCFLFHQKWLLSHANIQINQ